VFSRLSGPVFLFTALLTLLSLAACARKETRTVERLAVLPFENLSSDPSLDWAGPTTAAALVYDLASAPNLSAQSVASMGDAESIRASRFLQGYLVARSGRVEIRATLIDPRKTTTVASFAFDGPLAEGPLPLVNQLAKRLNGMARAFSTGNPGAFRDYGIALSTPDRASALRGFESAIAADPNFTAASLASARLLLEGGDRDGARKILTPAVSTHPDAIDQARLDYVSATAAGDSAARVKSLETLARLTPADTQVPRELAELQVLQRQFPNAVRNFEAIAKLDPEDPQAWNQLGYGYALAQNLPGARHALERYRQLLPPQEVNPLDSLGEVSFYLGDFSGAERYFLQAHEKNPGEFAGGELIKAAQARLMLGDLPAADAIYQRYLGLLQHSQGALAGYQQAQWEFLTGRRKAAIARLEKLAPSLGGEARALALCQLSIWKLETGDTKAAADLASQAVSNAQTPRLRNISAVCRYLTAMPTTGSGSPAADAYASLFQRKFSQAVPILEALYRETNPTADAQVRTLLAWAYVETGRAQEAEQLLARSPIPLSSGEPLFADLIFPRYLYLRGAVFEKEGKRAEAKQSYELYLKYAGDLPGIFEDQAKARQSLSKL
jgi:tetratricopeptide (TPR) repeat protein/TolB-like protein